MKYLKLFPIALLAIAVNSCSSADDDTTNSDNQVNGSRWVIEKMMTTVTREIPVPVYDEYGGMYINTQTVVDTITDIFEYDDQGRIISKDNGEIKFEYLDGSIVISEGDDIVTYKTKNGLVSEMDGVYCQYNSNKELIKYYTDFSDMVLSWSSGLIVKSLDSDEGDEYCATYTYDNNTPINAGCIQSINGWLIDALHPGDGDYPELSMSGSYGKVPSKPVSKITYDDGDTWRYYYSNIDENGCPGVVTICNANDDKDKYELKWRRLN